MSRKIKLIWDFYGEAGLNTAKHHVIHLKEFAEKKQYELHDCGVEEQDQFVSAYLIVNEEKMIELRDVLKPKRGQWVD